MVTPNAAAAAEALPLREIDALLDRIRAGAMAGDWQNLSTQGPALEALLPALARLHPGPGAEAALSPLRHKARQAADCLAAATRGVRAARHRIEEIRQAQTSLSTYDGQGRKAEVKTTAPQLLQRF